MSDKEMLDVKVVEEIMRLSFNIKEGENPNDITVSYNDMINYTKFIMENVLNSAIDCTNILLTKENKNNNKLNMK